MTDWVDTSRASLFVPEVLAVILGDLSADELRDCEEAFRLAAYGRPIGLPGDEHEVAVFSHGTRVLAWEVGSIIRSHRLHGTSLLDDLTLLADTVAAHVTNTEIENLETLWAM